MVYTSSRRAVGACRDKNKRAIKNRATHFLLKLVIIVLSIPYREVQIRAQAGRVVLCSVCPPGVAGRTARESDFDGRESDATKKNSRLPQSRSL